MSTGNSANFQKDKFVENFLDPVSKVTDTISFAANEDGIAAVCNNDANIILYAKYPGFKVNAPVKINIDGVKRFIRLLECIENDNVELDVSSNTFNYKTPKLKFKYHFADDAMIPLNKLNVAKINALTFDSMFFVDRSMIQEVIKCSAVVAGNNSKVYFTLDKSEGVRAEVTDLQVAQTDSVGLRIAEEYQGTDVTTPLPISLDVLRIVAGIKFDKMLIKINTSLKVLLFEIQKDDATLKYIISSLVK